MMLIISTSLGCTKHSNEHVRPKGVPTDAVWAGGADGGSYIKCVYNSKDGLLYCTVYNDYTGDVRANGPFKITGPSKPENVSKFKYSGYDGKKIYLLDGSVISSTVEPTIAK